MYRRLDENFERLWIEFAGLRANLARRHRVIARVGWALVAVFLAQTIALIVGVIALS
jgi:hypothetical protein